MKKRFLSILALMLSLVMTLSACGGGSSSEESAPPDDASTEEETVEVVVPEGRVEVKYWSPYTGNSADFVDGIINEFNEMQETYFVVREYNGGYYDQIAKLQATDQSALPALCNSSSETVGSYLHSGLIKNMQEFIDADGEWNTELYGNLVATYGVDGKMVGMPLGMSLSGFFYNKEVFEAAGIDPYSLNSMVDVAAAAAQICEGGFAKYGIAEEHSGIWANYAFHREGFYTTDNNNGVDGLPTKVLYDDNSNGFADVVKTYYQCWSDLAANEYIYPFGAKIKDDLIPALGAGELAMIVTTNSYHANVTEACEANGSSFGFVPMFSVTDDGKQTGYCASGNGFFIVDNGNAQAQQGAWEFVKYFLSVDVQLRWDMYTGYLPMYDEILNSEEYQAFLADEKTEYINVIIEALQGADNSAFYAFVANNNEYTPAGATCLEAVIAGESVDDAIATMCETINMSFEMYNATNK